MPQFPTISVIIPSYNGGAYLAQTLATVAKQDYPPHEVLVIDGGSTDNTRRIVDAYGALISTFISEPDKGQLDAVGKGVRLATGDVLYWLNSDDAAMPGAFRTVAQAFAEDPATEIVFADDYAFDAAARKLYVGSTIRGMHFWDHLLYYRQMYSECIFWRREISEQAWPLDTSLRVYTDYSFFLPLRYCRRHKWVPTRLGAFRLHPQQMSTKLREKGDAERELIKSRMCQRLGLTAEEFQRRRRKHYWSFLLRQRLYAKLDSGVRYAGRLLTGDRARRRMAEFLFDEWLRPPAPVAEKLDAGVSAEREDHA